MFYKKNINNETNENRKSTIIDKFFENKIIENNKLWQ